MFLTRDQASVLFYDFSNRFQTALGEVQNQWQGYSSLMPSSTRQTLYHWVDQVPSLRKWVGGKVKQNAALRDYELANEDYEETIALGKYDSADDIRGALAPVVTMQGNAAGRWPDEVMTSAVVNGTTRLCFDGQAFFYANHPVSMDDPSRGVYSNNLVGASYNLLGNDPMSVWQAASETMSGYVGASGAPLGLIADTLMVPPNMTRAALSVAKLDIVPQTFTAGGNISAAAGVSNIYKGTINVIVNPRMPQTNPFGVVMCTSLGILPFIWQLRQSPVYIPQTDPSLSQPFYEKEFVHGIEARGAGGYSLPFLAIRVALS
jgi:phage major head subunit gpT-like protein